MTIKGVNYRIKYADEVGACASCINIRSVIKGDTIRDNDILIPYDGGKEARCEINPFMDIYIREEPDINLPVNECWERAGEPHE
jgi:hypothetical protein